MISDSPIFLGTAGWSLPREHWAAFASEGSQLQRYAGRFAAVEINSSFCFCARQGMRREVWSFQMNDE